MRAIASGLLLALGLVACHTRAVHHGDVALRDGDHSTLFGSWRGMCEGMETWSGSTLDISLRIWRGREAPEASGTLAIVGYREATLTLLGRRTGAGTFVFEGEMRDVEDNTPWEIALYIESIQPGELGGEIREVISSYQQDIMCQLYWYRDRPSF